MTDNWDVHKYGRNDINGGNQFTYNDGIAPDDINAVVGNSFYAAESVDANTNLVNNIYAEYSSTPTVSGDPAVTVQNATVSGNQTKKFVFQSIHGRDVLTCAGATSGEPDSSIQYHTINFNTTTYAPFNRLPVVGDVFLQVYSKSIQSGSTTNNTYLASCKITNVSNGVATFVFEAIAETTGSTGEQGVGILSTYKDSTSGLVDTYKIRYSNNTFDTFTVTNGAVGATPTIQAANGSDIATVGTPSVAASTSGTTTTFTFHQLKGQKGDTGNDGRGITSISKTGTSGLTDTYTINYSNNTTSTYTVTNGKAATVNGSDTGAIRFSLSNNNSVLNITVS